MRFSLLLLASTLTASVVSAQKYVFAHVVMGNTAHHTTDNWATDIKTAQAAGIDAFALNIATGDTNIPTQVANAFKAATTLGSSFKLFFSFDYLGGSGAWPATGASSVASYLNQYGVSSAYFKYNDQIFASTFEGVNNAGDWTPGGPIRSAVQSTAGSIYFVPDYTSLGPSGFTAQLNNVQGAFSWDMWPAGPVNMTTANDLAWQKTLGSKAYMMGVSPWFFHSDANPIAWMWRGDDLWYQRWQQVLQVQPQFVEYVFLSPFLNRALLLTILSNIKTNQFPQDCHLERVRIHPIFESRLAFDYLIKYQN